MKLMLVIPQLVLMYFISASATVYQYDQTAEVLAVLDESRMSGIRNRTNKDFILGGLFPIHNLNSNGGGCGDFRQQGGLERMEAMLFAIDIINADAVLLPNLTLGFDIRDTCSVENIGLDEALDLIVTGRQLNIETCESDSTSRNVTDVLPPTVGIVGASLSRVSVPVASLGRLFDMPQVSYASTSALLSNKDKYSYFFRTIPSDNLEVQAIIEFLLHFNWTYISAVYSRDSYGQSGITDLRKRAEEYDICIDVEEGIDSDFDYRTIARKLANSNAKVVVLYALQEHAERLLEEVIYTAARQTFTWIASSAWAQAVDIVRRFNETTAGMFGTVPLKESSNDFDEYYSQLTIQSNRRNPWFPQFYASLTNCSLSLDCSIDSNLTSLPHYEQEYAVPLVVDAIYVFAHALHNFLAENCEQPVEWYRENQTCKGQKKELNGSIFLSYIADVKFESPTENVVQFDSLGNVEGVYEILNYQVVNDSGGNREFEFVRIGTWSSSAVNDTNVNALQLNTNATLQFGLNGVKDVLYELTLSECGKCRPGEYHKAVQSSCCGICEPCLGRMYSNESLAPACRDCSITGEMWGNNPLTGSDDCVASPEVSLTLTDPFSIVVMVISIVGLIFTLAVAIVFVIYWKTPIVKSSSREQMILLLIGIGLSFLATFIYVSPPLLGICIVQRIVLWLCFSLTFGSLLVKIVRVARVFMQKATLSKLRCMEAQHQIVFTLLIVLGQMLLVALSLGIQPPGVIREVRLNEDNPINTPTVVVTCKADHIVALVLSAVYESGLLIVATVLGTLSFKYPANFNESKCICFSAFSLLVIWVAFIPTYIATQARQEIQNSFIACAVVVSAFAILICFFSPKVFVIFFWRERNSKHYCRQRVGSNQCNTNTHGSVLTISLESSQYLETRQGRYTGFYVEI